MTVMAPERVDKLVAGWRDFTDEQDSPAGPLFLGGYAEQEITMTGTFTQSVTCPSSILIDYCEGHC